MNKSFQKYKKNPSCFICSFNVKIKELNNGKTKKEL